MATYDNFAALDIRVGVIIAVDDFPEARKPAYKLTIDFGNEIGQKRSSVQVVTYYKKDELVGKRCSGGKFPATADRTILSSATQRSDRIMSVS